MDERTQRVISNSVSEYLTVRNASEGLATFTTLAAEERPALVSAFIEKAIDGKPAIVSTVVDLFRAVADAGVIQQQAMRDAFTQAVAELQDTATEAPAAYDNLGRLMTAAGLDEGDVQHLQGLMTSVDEGDEQGLQDARKRLMDAYRAAFASSTDTPSHSDTEQQQHAAMSWRANRERTGANEAPLASQRRWGGGNQSQGGYDDRDRDRDRGGYSQQQQQGGYGGGQQGGGGYSNGYSDQHRGPPPSSSYGSSHGGQQLAPPPNAAVAEEPRKRKSRWGDEKERIQVAGLPTAISGNVQGKDLENYAIHVRLEEIARKLRSGDVIPPERERSPSPPPTYDHHGRRTNTRDIRYKKKLEEERNRLVEKAIRSDPNYKPPTEYLMAKRMSGRPSEKIYIPAKEFPEIKWIGLILGPRGNSLKQMERETGAKIVIRGKGSTKEGKGNFGNRSADEDDELHCNITADSMDKVEACAKLINKVIATAASTPDEQNDHKRNQLRELAMLNGTLRDDENQPCQNCGKLGHRKYDCPEQRNFTANVVCRNCGNMGHMARDCIAHRNKPGGAGFGGAGAPGAPQTTPQFDSEYSALMAELGEGPGANIHQNPAAAAEAASAAADRPIPPWRNPANWHPPQNPNAMGGGGGGGPGRGYNQPYQPQGYAGYAAQQSGYDPSQGAGGPAAGGYDYAAYYGGQQQQGQYGAPGGYGQYGVAA